MVKKAFIFARELIAPVKMLHPNKPGVITTEGKATAAVFVDVIVVAVLLDNIVVVILATISLPKAAGYIKDICYICFRYHIKTHAETLTASEYWE